MEIKLFSIWRPSAILNLGKLQFCSCVLYRHVIFHLCSKFRIDRPIWRPDIAKKRFSIWCPSSILNLLNYGLLLKIHDGNWDVHRPTKFDRNRIILDWDMEILLFSKCRPSAILNLRKLQFWSRDLYRHEILHFYSKFRVEWPIWHEILPKTIFNMASVHHLEFA